MTIHYSSKSKILYYHINRVGVCTTSFIYIDEKLKPRVSSVVNKHGSFDSDVGLPTFLKLSGATKIKDVTKFNNLYLQLKQIYGTNKN